MSNTNLVYSPATGIRIVAEAGKFKGLSETLSNRKWDDKSTAGQDPRNETLVAMLKAAGWQMGWPYCAAFCEAVWKVGYAGLSELQTVKDMLNPGVLESYRRAAEKDWVSKTPQIGAIGCMRKSQTANGHAFIVTGISPDGKRVSTIEANTSPTPADAAQDREGDGIYAKYRNVVYKPTTGLHLIGFIVPFVKKS